MSQVQRILPGVRVGIRPPTQELSEALSRCAQLIRDNTRFMIVGHADPDGDVIGSCLGLYHLLRALGKEVVVFNVDPVPFNFLFLPGSQQMVRSLPADASFDVTFLLDCSCPTRVGERFPAQGWGVSRVIIDHHSAIQSEAEVVVHDPSAAATGELIYRLVAELGVELDRSMAECIYCSLLTDTGSFRYGSTSATALIMAGELVATGIDVWHVTSHVYESNPVERILLLGKVLQTLDVSPDGRLAMVRISKRLFEEGGGDEAIFDGFINHARSIRGVEVAVQLRELGPEHFQVVLRSAGQVHVGQLASRFQGRGRRNGAVCEMTGGWESIRDRLYAALCAMDSEHHEAATTQQG